MSKTSTAVKRKYNAKTYTRLAVDLRNEDFARFEAAKGDLSRAEFIRRLLNLYEETTTKKEI